MLHSFLNFFLDSVKKVDIVNGKIVEFKLYQQNKQIFF